MPRLCREPSAMCVGERAPSLGDRPGQGSGVGSVVSFLSSPTCWASGGSSRAFPKGPRLRKPPVQRRPAGGDAQTSSELWHLVNGSTTLDRDKERGRQGGLSNGHASPGAWPLSLRDGCPPRLGGGRSSRGRVRPQSWRRGPSGQAFPLGALSSPCDRLSGGLRTVPARRFVRCP